MAKSPTSLVRAASSIFTLPYRDPFYAILTVALVYIFEELIPDRVVADPADLAATANAALTNQIFFWGLLALVLLVMNAAVALIYHIRLCLRGVKALRAGAGKVRQRDGE
ncbi:hypothetical protein [Sphingomonas sp. 3-13AW]|uniref:hypothetical protein n=1 Tax=Sphingomonas sp. 3-13AW TaxID=3050450 RepID=UPI003BB73743